MKRCPECRRDYYDDTLLYCLDDGNALLDGPASIDEPATAFLSPSVSGDGEFYESVTRAQIHTTAAQARAQRAVSDATERPGPTVNRSVKPLAAAAVAILILVGGYVGYRYFSVPGREQIDSIAVLPFENRSGNADTDYLSDGLAESLIYRLSQLPGLKVSPTSTVLRYKGSKADVASIAKELEVNAIMSGRVTQRGDDLTISVELIDARTRKLIWAEQYDRKLSDLLATQREIATTITQKLELKLSGNDAKGITKK